MNTTRYPTRKKTRMSNGVTWMRWHGFGWWTQDLVRAANNDREPLWPVRPWFPIWSSKSRRLAVLLPNRNGTRRGWMRHRLLIKELE